MARERPRRSTPCPHCGAAVPAGRPACRECGSDAETGWNEDALDGYSAADIPDTFTDEDYRDAVADLPGAETRGTGPASRRKRTLQVVGLFAVLAFLAAFVVPTAGMRTALVVVAVLLLIFASPIRRVR